MQSLAYRHIFFEVYHWENDRPGLPHPGFQCKTRFKKPLSWSKAKSFKNFQIWDSLAPFRFDARGQSCCWKMETDNFFSETKNNWRSYKSWEVATISDSEYHIQIFYPYGLLTCETNIGSSAMQRPNWISFLCWCGWCVCGLWKCPSPKCMERSVPMWCASLDLRKEFDCVDYNALFWCFDGARGSICIFETSTLFFFLRTLLAAWRSTGTKLFYWAASRRLASTAGWRGQGGGRGVEDLRPSCGGERGLQTTGWQRRTSLRRGWGERTTWTPEPHGLLLGVEGGWSGLWRWQACGWSWMLHCSTCLLLRCQGRPSGICFAAVLDRFFLCSTVSWSGWVGTRATISNQTKCETRRRSAPIAIQSWLGPCDKEVEISCSTLLTSLWW